MNRTLVEHWQKHGLAVIVEENDNCWYWSNKANEINPKVLAQLVQFEKGSLVLVSMRRLMREAGFDPFTCMLSDKKTDSGIYTVQDFIEMSESNRFGFWMLCKFNDIELPEPKDYADAYNTFTDEQQHDICEYLADQGLNKDSGKFLPLRETYEPI